MLAGVKDEIRFEKSVIAAKMMSDDLDEKQCANFDPALDGEDKIEVLRVLGFLRGEEDHDLDQQERDAVSNILREWKP